MTYCNAAKISMYWIQPLPSTNKIMFATCNEFLLIKFEDENMTKFWNEIMIDCIKKWVIKTTNYNFFKLVIITTMSNYNEEKLLPSKFW